MKMSLVEKETLLRRAYKECGIRVVGRSMTPVLTDSTLFLTNMILRPNFHILRKKYGLVNVYLNDECYHEEAVRNCGEPLIFVLISNLAADSSVDFVSMENTLKSHSNWMDSYDIVMDDRTCLVMHVFRVPRSYRDDYEHFLNGRFSYINKSLVANYDPMVREICNKTDASHKYWSEFYGIQIPMGQEYYSIYDIYNETFRYGMCEKKDLQLDEQQQIQI
jgi:hypothetical protein